MKLSLFPSPFGRRRLRLLAVAVPLLLGLTVGPAPADDDPLPVLTLEEAIRIAETSSHELGAADARLDAARAGEREARSFRLPKVELQGGYQRSTNPVLVFSNLLRQESFGPENFAIDSLNHPDALDNWNTQVVLEQPLWTGGLLAASEAAARHVGDATQAERERTRQQVVRRVTEAYANAVVAALQLNVAHEAQETAAAHVRLIGDLYEGGLVVESDLLLAQVRESEVQEVVIRARSGVQVSRAALNLAMGRDLSTDFALPADLELEAAAGGELDALLARALDGRPDLAAAEGHVAAATSQVGAARAGRKPRVGLGASYETNAEDFFGNDGDNWTVMVGLKYTLFDGSGTKARIERARQQAREAEERTELLRQSVALEVRQAFHELEAAGQRLEQARRGVELASRSLTIVEDRYKNGLTTLPDFLGAETALTEARLREVAARRDVLLARATLDLATGSL